MIYFLKKIYVYIKYNYQSINKSKHYTSNDDKLDVIDGEYEEIE